MAEQKEVLGTIFSRYLTGFALSKALFEDYSKVIAKLENVPENEVKDRIWKRADEIFMETLEKQRKETQEALQSS